MKTAAIFFITLFAPLWKWPFGEDGKYVHAVLGMMAVGFALVVLLVMQQEEINPIGLSIVALFTGIMIERIQRIFLNGKNTLKESLFDIFYTWTGGTIIALMFYLWKVG